MNFENYINHHNGNRSGGFYKNRHRHGSKSKLQLLFRILEMAVTSRKLRWFIVAVLAAGIGIVALIAVFILPLLFNLIRRLFDGEQVKPFLDSIIN